MNPGSDPAKVIVRFCRMHQWPLNKLKMLVSVNKQHHWILLLRMLPVHHSCECLVGRKSTSTKWQARCRCEAQIRLWLSKPPRDTKVQQRHLDVTATKMTVCRCYMYISHQVRLLYNSKHLFTWPMGTPVGSFLKPGATEPIKVGQSSFNFLPFLRIFGPRLSSLCGSHFCHEFLFDKDWRGHRNNLKTLLGSLSF